jgi:hypothetical protein
MTSHEFLGDSVGELCSTIGLAGLRPFRVYPEWALTSQPVHLPSVGAFVDKDEDRPDFSRADARKCSRSHSEPDLPRLEKLAMPYGRWMPPVAHL